MHGESACLEGHRKLKRVKFWEENCWDWIKQPQTVQDSAEGTAGHQQPDLQFLVSDGTY